MSKYLVLCDEGYYPSIYVVESKEVAEIIYKGLTEGYKDWGDELMGRAEGNVQVLEVEDTPLTTADWNHIRTCHPLLGDVVFL